MDRLTNLPPEILYPIGELVLTYEAEDGVCRHCNIDHKQFCSLSSFRLTCKVFAILGAQVVIAFRHPNPYVDNKVRIYKAAEVVEAVLDNPIFSSKAARVSIISNEASSSPSVEKRTKRIFQKARELSVDLEYLESTLFNERPDVKEGYGFTLIMGIVPPDDPPKHRDPLYVFRGAQSLILRDALFSPLRHEGILDSADRLTLEITTRENMECSFDVSEQDNFERNATSRDPLQHEEDDKQLVQLIRRASTLAELDFIGRTDGSIHLIDALLQQMSSGRLRALAINCRAAIPQHLAQFIDRHSLTLEWIELHFHEVDMEAVKLRAIVQAIYNCKNLFHKEIKVRKTHQCHKAHPAEKALNKIGWENIINDLDGVERTRYAGSFVWPKKEDPTPE